MSNVSISFPLSSTRIESIFRRMDEDRAETTRDLQETIGGDPSHPLMRVLTHIQSGKGQAGLAGRKEYLLSHWRQHPQERLVSVLLGWIEEMEGEGGLLVPDGTEDDSTPLMNQYIREVFALVTVGAWSKAWLHLEAMRREFGDALLETLDLDSLYWLDVEVTA